MKTSKMIEMLEKNPNLKFRLPAWDVSLLCADSSGRMRVINRLTGDTVETRIPMADTWEIFRQPVQLWEAVKALQEGKAILHVPYGYDDMGERTYHNAIFLFKSDSRRFESGSWYILEDGEDE